MIDPALGWATERLVLEPIDVRHAAELATPLADPALHTFTGDPVLALGALTGRYELLSRRRSPDGSHLWGNWVLRLDSTLAAIGYVQATWPVAGPEVGPAELAWVVGMAWQRQGFAREAAAPLVAAFVADGWTVVAHVHPDHVASGRVAAALGLSATEVLVEGEVRWQSGRS